MVYLRLVSSNNGTLTYEYMPEKKEAMSGSISIDSSTREKKLLKSSPQDVGTLYASKAARALEKMLDSSRVEDELYLAWY